MALFPTVSALYTNTHTYEGAPAQNHQEPALQNVSHPERGVMEARFNP